MTQWWALTLTVSIPVLALSLWVLRDMVQTPDEVWSRSGRDKIGWILLAMAMPLVGSISYLLLARRDLKRGRGEMGPPRDGAEE